MQAHTYPQRVTPRRQIAFHVQPASIRQKVEQRRYLLVRNALQESTQTQQAIPWKVHAHAVVLANTQACLEPPRMPPVRLVLLARHPQLAVMEGMTALIYAPLATQEILARVRHVRPVHSRRRQAAMHVCRVL